MMSKGLGKLERDILDTLKENERPLLASELAWLFHNEGKDERDYSNPPTSFQSATRRAIHSLKLKGLIDCTRGYGRTRSNKGRGLFCWLAAAPAAQYVEKVEPIKGEDAESAILAALTEFEQLEDWAKEYEINPYEREEQIRYTWVISHASTWLEKKAGANHWVDGARLGMALNRAVKRLVKKGLIKAYWRNHKGRYAWVVNVAKLEKKLTMIHLEKSNSITAYSHNGIFKMSTNRSFYDNKEIERWYNKRVLIVWNLNAARPN